MTSIQSDLEFFEKEYNYQIKIQPHLTPVGKNELINLINNIDGGISIKGTSSISKDAFEELCTILEESSFTYVLVSESESKKRRFNDITNQKPKIFKPKELRNPFVIEVENKLRVCSLDFVFRSDIVNIIRMVRGRFWSRYENKWYMSIDELPFFQRKVALIEPKYKIVFVVSDYELNQEEEERIRRIESFRSYALQ